MSKTYKIDGQTYDDLEIRTLLKAKALTLRGEKNTPGSTTLDGQPLQGYFPGNTNQYGIFSRPGVRPQRLSTLQRTPTFLSAVGAPQPSEYYDEILGIMTGQSAGGTTNATGWCGTPPEVGQLLTMERRFRWGRYMVKSTLNSVPDIGALRNRADIPGQILNAGPTENPLIPDIMFQLADTRDQLAIEMYKIGVDLGRTLAQVGIQGVQGSNNNRTGWWQEFDGLDTQIKTGYTDYIATNITANAVDSIAVNFNTDINGTASDGRTYVQVWLDTWFALKTKAARIGMSDVNFAIVMRREQFRRTTEVWACNYAITRCTSVQAGQPVTRDGMDVVALRLDMQERQYLLMDGDEVPVLFDEGIVLNTEANNSYMSDAYIVPLDWQGMPLVRLEYFPMNNPYAQRYANFVATLGQVMNNGMFYVTRNMINACEEYVVMAMMRLILEAPFLSARIDNTQYTYLSPTNTTVPGQSMYVNGGVSYVS